MPRSDYFGGHGNEVARDMQKRHGDRWKQVFYATANARKQTPYDRSSPKKKRKTPYDKS